MRPTVRPTFWCLPVFALFFVVLAGCPVNTPPPAGETNTLSPGFGSSFATGEVQGINADGTCPGFFPATATRTITLTQAIAGMRIRASSETVNTDVVVMVRFGNTTFCGNVGDDSEVFRGNWSAGVYEIFVGTEDQNDRADFDLLITEP